MTNEPARYYPRFSQADDQNKLLDFYNSAEHKNVLQRDETLLKKLISDGAVVLIEDAAGTVVAASITYPYATADDEGKEDVKWQEIGTLRCVLNGYGLFDALLSLQTLRTFLVEPPSDSFITHMETTPVQNMAKNLGFRTFIPPREILEIKAETLPPGANDPRRQKTNWYQIGTEAMPDLARTLVNLFDNPVIENKHTHDKIILDFSRCDFNRMFMPVIRNLAAAGPRTAATPKRQPKGLSR